MRAVRNQGGRELPQAPLLDKNVLVTELNELADEPSLALRSGELHALADDLRHERRLDQWAEVDLLQAFVRPESVAPEPQTTAQRASLVARIAALRRTRPWQGPGVLRWLRDELRGRSVRYGVLETVLGMLVFIPLLITWLGLREAVRAYGELSDEKSKEATRPFLQLWQSGFDGHLKAIGRFENVALTTAVLIIMLVLLSGWHSHARSRAERDEAERHDEREHLLGRLAATLTRVQMVVSGHRRASPQQFVAELSKAAKQMERLAAKAENSHKTLNTGAQAARQATTALESAARRLGDELPKLSSATARIEDAVRVGHQAGADASKNSADAARDVADRIRSAGDTVHTALSTLTAAQQTLAAKSESVAQATDRASRALVDSTRRTGDAIEGMRRATELWDTAAAHWVNAAHRVDARIGGLTAANPWPAAPVAAPGDVPAPRGNGGQPQEGSDA